MGNFSSRHARWRAHLFSPRVFPPLVVGFIGDSITGGALASDAAHYAVNVCGVALSAARNSASVTVINQAVAGTTSHDWIPTFGTHLSDAVTAFLAAGATLVHVMLGTNDAKTNAPNSASFYHDNFVAMLATLVSNGFKVVLSYPPYVDYTNPGNTAWTSASTAALAGYQPVIDGLVDNVNVFQGDTTAFTYFQSNPTLLTDGVHPGDAGHAYLGAKWAAKIFLVP